MNKSTPETNSKFSLLRKLREWVYQFKSMSFVKHILVFYLFITIVGALLLYSHPAQTGNLSWEEEGMHGNSSAAVLRPGYISFIDAIFTSASAFSDTGLAPRPTAVTFSVFGQAVIAILIFIGGIGWFALKVYIFNIIFGRPIALRTRESLAAERGSVKIGITRDLIRVAVTTLLVLTALFSVVLTIYFYYADVPDTMKTYPTFDENGNRAAIKLSNFIYENPHGNALVSLRYGIFHTISALNNAGFDIIGNYSLTPYYYNFGLQIIFIILFVIGGMGYPVIYDVYRYFQTRFHGERFRFSLFTKLSVSAYILIALIGLGCTFAIETNSDDNFWRGSTEAYGSTGDKIMAVFFNTMSTRNAGFSTISMHDLSRATLVQYTIMMFIGSAPSSTAGGIRTTTLALVVLGVWARFRGRTEVYAFKRKINKDTVNRAYVVFSLSIIIIILGTLVSISSFDTNGGEVPTLHGKILADGAATTHATSYEGAYDFSELLFEVTSAFGTTGLSSGMTSHLSTWTKLALTLIMFIGQLGVSSSVLIWGRRKSSAKHFSRVESDITIG